MIDFSLDFGVLYAATGEKHSSEAIKNLSLSKSLVGNFKSCLVTDKIRSNEEQLFDIVRIHDSPVFGYRDKISSLLDLPFSFTLFLDSDAFICSSLNAICASGLISDFSAAHAPVRHPPGWSDLDVPLFFPEFNSGVMFLKKSPVVYKLISDWLSIYDLHFSNSAQSWDQASLRSALWSNLKQNTLSLSVLPPECNLRTTKPWIAGRGLPVSVVHGRFDFSESDAFLSFLNSDIDRFRTWTEWLDLYPNSSIRPRFDRTYS